LHGEGRRVDGGEVIDPVGHGATPFLDQKIVYTHLLGVALGPPFATRVFPVERPVDRVARGLQRGSVLTVEISIVFDNRLSCFACLSS